MLHYHRVQRKATVESCLHGDIGSHLWLRKCSRAPTRGLIDRWTWLEVVFLVRTAPSDFLSCRLISPRISLPIGAFAMTIMSLSFKQPMAALPVPCPLKKKLLSLDLAGACLVLGMSGLRG